MSAPTAAGPALSGPVAVPAAAAGGVIVIEDLAIIPQGAASDLDAFRRWARSDAFPERGWFAYLDGILWVDTSMEELLTHNRVKVAYTATLFGLLQQTGLGSFVADRMRLSHAAANLSVEPDGLFHSWATLQSGRLRLVPGVHGGIIELEGTPDMVLEIVSATSVSKDTVRLRDLYWRAGVQEYWLVDARGEKPQFDILRHTATGYVAVEPRDGWLTSTVFGHQFQLTQHSDPLGHPLFVVATRAPQPVSSKG